MADGSSPQIPEAAEVAAVKRWREDASAHSVGSGLPIDLRFRRALQAAYPHLLAAFSEALDSDEFETEIRQPAMECSDAQEIAVRIRAIIRDRLATLNVSGGADADA